MEGKVVGYVAVRMESDDSPRNMIKKGGYISNIVVLKDYRGRGYGAALLKKAEEFTIANNAQHIALDVQVKNPSVDLYHKHGYRERTMWMDKKIG